MIEQEGRTVYCTLLPTQHSTCRTPLNHTASTPAPATSTTSSRRIVLAITLLASSKWVPFLTCSHDPQRFIRQENQRTHHLSLRKEPYFHQERGRVGKNGHLSSGNFRRAGLLAKMDQIKNQRVCGGQLQKNSTRNQRTHEVFQPSPPNHQTVDQIQPKN